MIHGVHGPVIIRDYYTLQYHIQVSILQVANPFVFAVDSEFYPGSCQATDYNIVIYCFSGKPAALRSNINTDCLGIRILCQSMDLHVYSRNVVSVSYGIPTKCVGLLQNGHHHHHIIKMPWNSWFVFSLSVKHSITQIQFCIWINIIHVSSKPCLCYIIHNCIKIGILLLHQHWYWPCYYDQLLNTYDYKY